MIDITALIQRTFPGEIRRDIKFMLDDKRLIYHNRTLSGEWTEVLYDRDCEVILFYYDLENILS